MRRVLPPGKFIHAIEGGAEDPIEGAMKALCTLKHATLALQRILSDFHTVAVTCQVPSVSYADVQREKCRRWYPTDEFLRIVDSKQREWLVYDANSTVGFRYEYPLGSSQAIVRVFWREDHVREWRLADGSCATEHRDAQTTAAILTTR
jgi:hypothetical protein